MKMQINAKTVWIVLNTSLVVLLIGALVWLASVPRETPPAAPDPTNRAVEPSGPVLRIGLTPERDIFAQRNRYRGLADYISRQIGRPVRLVLVNTYEGVLKDFEEKEIDGAFLGSLVATLAIDRLGARPIVKPQGEDGSSSYHGVLFVRGDSPIKKAKELAGKSIAMVRTTTAGHVFPGCVIMEEQLWGRPDQPKMIWLGTHDDVVTAVMEGRADIGAVKNLRLNALLKTHPDWKIRRLLVSRDVPNNALVLRADVADESGAKLRKILLAMNENAKGRNALNNLCVARFVRCDDIDYSVVYDMLDCIVPAWEHIGLSGDPPKRPAAWPKPDPKERHRCYEESS